MENLPEQIKPNLFQTLSESNSSSVEIVRQFGSYSLEKIVEERFPTVGQIQTLYGAEKVELAIAIVVNDLSRFFNNDLKQEQAQEIAVEFTSTILRNVTLEGIFITCQQIKRSDLKFKLSANIILREMHKHLEEQSQLIMQKNYNDHLAKKFNATRSSETKEDLYARFKMDQFIKNSSNEGK